MISTITITAVISFLFCGLARHFLQKLEILDIPNERSSHAMATIRGGGVAIISCVAIIFFVEDLPKFNVMRLYLILVTTVLVVVSFYDDIWPISSGTRLVVHFGVGLAIMYIVGLFGKEIVIHGPNGFQIPALLSGTVFLFWIAGYTNAFNFMDGLNGMASLQGVITSWAACFLAVVWGGLFEHWAFSLSIIIGAACLGFVPFNFPRARMFMGDVGSAPVGMLLSVTVIGLAQASDWELLIPLMLLHANFFLDTGLTLVRRFLKGEKWYSAHRSHFYQKLQRAGKSHTFVTSVEMILQVVVLGLMWIYLTSEGVLAGILVGGVLAIWLVFFWYCERAFRLSHLESP